MKNRHVEKKFSCKYYCTDKIFLSNKLYFNFFIILVVIINTCSFNIILRYSWCYYVVWQFYDI